MLASLETELASLESQAQGTSTSYIFSRNLSWGMTGPDVNELQNYLVAQDKGPAAEKLEAHGTTEYFGPLTYNALVEFQKAVGIIPASGYFGPITRAWVGEHE